MAKNTFKNKPQAKSKQKPKIAKPRKPIFGFLSDRRFQIAIGFFLVGLSIFLVVAFVSYLYTGKADQSVVEAITDTGIKSSGLESQNWLGLLGAYLAYLFIFKWFGIASFLIPPLLFVGGYKIIYRTSLLPLEKTFYFTVFFLFWISILLGFQVISSDQINDWGFLSGGLGYELAILFDSLFGWGTYIILLFSLVIFGVYFFNIQSIFKLDTSWLKRFSLWESSSHLKTDRPQVAKVEDESTVEIKKVVQEVLQEIEFDTPVNPDIKPRKAEADPQFEVEIPPAEPERPATPQNTPRQPVQNGQEQEDLEPEEEIGFEVSEQVAQEKKVEHNVNYDPTLDLGSYQYPVVELLTDYPDKGVRVTKEELEQNKDRIVETLINFKIGINSIKATIGPTVTLYEIVPEAGVKISKIKNLEDDIALSLAALGIRIIAPIPGKGTIGIEVPNKNREMVDIKSVMTTEKFMESEFQLPIVLGKTIANELYITDLTKMPHLLMAGATGQGKSVGLNVILTSLLYKKHPSQLKLVLVDPKKVELTLFNKIERHFLAKIPNSEDAIITDTKTVVYTLNSLCIEMDQRYDLLKDAGCRNIKEYNKKFVSRKLNPEKGHRYLPYIVLVIDELADLMMTAGKEVEAPIARLAQLARAIGIHLIIATQRPSVNVITGIIKANFPARLSYRVTSKIDSRTILDTGGAEQLVGMGDMLLSMGSDIVRLQCPFVDTPEIEGICDFIGGQRGYESAYHLPEFVGDESGDGNADVDLKDRDALFDEAARLIVTHQQGSTSLIQRKMKLGYNRAGRLIDQLEAAGIVGPFEGSKAREVLIKDEYSLEQLLNDLNN